MATPTLRGSWGGARVRVRRAARGGTGRGSGCCAGARPAVCAAAGVEAGSVSAVLLAGGVGKRMKATMPKQYLPLNGAPIATYSLRLLAGLPEVAEVVVVCDPSYRDVFQDVGIEKPLKFALPGAERQDSVENGLAQIADGAALVCVHDSARPLVTVEEVEAVFADAAHFGAAVLGVPCKATVKEATPEGMVVKTLDRSTLWEMHTPQVMRPQLLRDGFDLVKKEGLAVTDDVSIVEALGEPVKITLGSYENLKVTTPEDLVIAERLLAERAEAAANAAA